MPNNKHPLPLPAVLRSQWLITTDTGFLLPDLLSLSVNSSTPAALVIPTKSDPKPWTAFCAPDKNSQLVPPLVQHYKPSCPLLGNGSINPSHIPFDQRPGHPLPLLPRPHPSPISFDILSILSSKSLSYPSTPFPPHSLWSTQFHLNFISGQQKSPPSWSHGLHFLPLQVTLPKVTRVIIF